MSDTIVVALIVAIPSFIASIAALLQARAATQKIDATHLVVNSRMTQLLEAVKTGSLAEGREEGRGIEKQSVADEIASRSLPIDPPEKEE